jgi:hypothetical protein
MTRPRTKGPRSVIVTATDFPVLLCVTRTLVPNGNVRWAAVKAWSVILFPLAVLIPDTLYKRRAFKVVARALAVHL